MRTCNAENQNRSAKGSQRRRQGFAPLGVITLWITPPNLNLSKFTTNAKQCSFSILFTLLNRGTRQVFTVFDFKIGVQFHETLFLKGFCIFVSFLRVFIIFFLSLSMEFCIFSPGKQKSFSL